MFRNLSRRQWLTILAFAVADFCSAVCVSLQAPFYPKEAESKGATATEYGLVFGVFELTVFIVSPLLGKRLTKLGAKRVFCCGILTTGTCSVIFGVLDRIKNGKLFIAASIVVRSVEAIGNSGFLTASFSIIAKEFPDKVATMFASLETFFGIGLIVGPSVGGALYQIGGYTMPFVALGGILVTVACITMVILPSSYNEDPEILKSDDARKRGMMDALKVPSISLAAYSIICAAISIGFLQTTLEPHMRQFELSPVMMGLMFVINGGFYALFAPIWGYLCDQKLPGKLVTAFGAVLIAVSIMFLGPVAFIPIPTLYGVCIASLIVHGIGFAAQLVAGFSVAHRQALANGFPDNLNTYALISGLWTSAFAFGAFLGPTIAGIMVDKLGFAHGSLLVVISQITVLIFTMLYTFKMKRKTRSGYEEIGEDSPIIESDRQSSLGYGSQSSSDQEEPGASRPQIVSERTKHIFSPIASPLEGLTAGVTGVSLAVSYQKSHSDFGECESIKSMETLMLPPKRGAAFSPKRQIRSQRTHDDDITLAAIIEGDGSSNNRRDEAVL